MGGATRRSALVALALVAWLGGEAAGDRLIIVEPYAAKDAADEGAAVGLLLRSLFSAPGLEVETIAPTADRDGTIEAARTRLKDTAGWVVVSEVARRGTGLRASVRLVGADGSELGAATVMSGEGAVTELARAAARFVGPRIGHTPLGSPAGSVGSLRAFARAAKAPPGEARALLASADPRVAGPVAATREIAATMWKDAKRPIDERMDAALLGLAPQQAIAMADEVLAKDPKDTHAAAVKARALIGSLALDDATTVLAKHAGSDDPSILLAQAELAHFKREPEARDAALEKLISGEADRRALAFVATLPAGVLSPALEQKMVAAAPPDDAWLASALGLRAVLGGIERNAAMALISARELDDKDAKTLSGALVDADRSAAAARLRAELAMRQGDARRAAIAIAAYAEAAPTDARTGLYRGRLLAEQGDLDGAAKMLEQARELEEAKLELARVLERAGRFADAEKLIEELQARDSLDGMLNRAKMLLTENKAREALAILRQAEGASPANPDVQAALAAALNDLGQTELAKMAELLAKQLAGGAVAKVQVVPVVDPTGPTASKTTLVDPATKDLASRLPDLMGAFPTLASFDKVVLVQLGGDPAPWYRPRKVDPARLRMALEVALAEPPYGAAVAAASTAPMSEPLSGAELKQVAEAAGAQAVLLYGLTPRGSSANAKLVLFDAAAGVALETAGEVPGDGGLVSWNRVFFAWTGGLLGILLMYVAYGLIRGIGELNIRLKLDPEARDEALSLLVTRSPARPTIGDPHGWRTAARAAGYRLRRRRADLVGPHTRIRRLEPGEYYVHLFGVFDRGGETQVLDDRWSRKVEVARGHATPLLFDMVPTHAELRLRLFDGGEPARGAEVWLAASSDQRHRLGDDGELRLELPLGEHQLHIEGKGVKLVRTLNFSAPTIERVSIQLDRERRLQEIAGDTSFLGGVPPAGSATFQPEQPTAAERAAVARGSQGMSAAASAATMAASIASGSSGGQATATSPLAGASIAVGQSMLGRYDIVKELGRGAMGVVLKARDHNLDRDVALKIISDELRYHPEALKLFMQEAKALAQLNHPNIVAVYDQSQHEGQAFMVMEFVDGNTLENVLAERGGRLPVAEALTMLDQLFAGLAYAHDRRVIHRDIKPANIFVSSEGIVKIGDFGLARVMRELSLRRTEIRGTPLYMAPEQITGTNVGHRADLYAAGCTAFEILTGRPPFIDGDIMYHHIHSEPPRPSSVDEEIPPELDELVMKCIMKDADARFESAHAIRDRLRLLRQRFG